MVRLWLFEDLDTALQDEIASSSTQVSCQKGDYLFRMGEAAESFYVLESGRVRLTVGEKGCVAQIIGSPGEIFGISSLLSVPEYTASAEVLEATRVLRIKGRHLNGILESHPEAGLIVFKRLALSIRERLIQGYRMLSTYDAENRPHSYG